MARSIKPFPDEMMAAWNFEISPTLLRDFLGHRLLIREQTSWGKLLVLGVTATLRTSEFEHLALRDESIRKERKVVTSLKPDA